MADESPDGVEMSCADYQRLMDFVRMTAKLTKDQECATCQKDGWDPNPECPTHEPWDMPNDDAVDTLDSLINEARSLLK